MADALTRTASLTGFADLARTLGLDPYRLVRDEHLPASVLTDPDLKVSADAVGRLLERAAMASGAPDFGLRLAETRRLSNLGVVGLVVRDQPTLRHALDILVGHSRAQNEAVSLHLDVEGDVAVLRQSIVAPGRRSSRQGRELSLGVLALTLRQLMGPTWRPHGVSFTHAALGDTPAYRRVFGVAPVFLDDFDGLVIDARDLDAAIAGADPTAAERALRYVEWEAGHPDRDLAATVRELLRALLPTGHCGIERVAAHLGASRRTLHRRLAMANGATFSELLDQTRLELMEQYLATGRHSLTEIAERLGYSSLSAFSRWRRRQASPRPQGS